jgi:ribosomal protein L7Ae-like RNA K-turn-binding protein
VREAGRSGLLQLAIIASDVSENTRDKLIPLLDARRIPYAVLGTRAELGVAVGRAPLSAVGVLSGTLAERILELIKPNSDQRAGISE